MPPREDSNTMYHSLPEAQWRGLIRQLRERTSLWRTELLLGLVIVALAATVLHVVTKVPATVFGTSLFVYLLIVFTVLYHAPSFPGQSGPGPANRVTFLRAALIVPVAALILHPAHLDADTTYWLLALATLALLLDGVDGAVARRTGSITRFGARFDMELDALLIMALAILVWQTGQAGIWVLLIGLMRYLFVAAGWRWQWLENDLPPSRRRQTICVVQSVALLVALVPLVPSGFAGAIALGALLVLTYSFIVDIRWLYLAHHRYARDSR